MQSSPLKRPRGKQTDEDGKTSSNKKSKESADAAAPNNGVNANSVVAVRLTSSPAPTGSVEVQGTPLPPVSLANDELKVGIPPSFRSAGPRDASTAAKGASASSDRQASPAKTDTDPAKSPRPKASGATPSASPTENASAAPASLPPTDPRSRVNRLLRAALVLACLACNVLLYCAWYDTAHELREAVASRDAALQHASELEATVAYLSNKADSQQQVLEETRGAHDRTIRDLQSRLNEQRGLLEEARAECRP